MRNGQARSIRRIQVDKGEIVKQHAESLISYVMEWSGKSRSEAIEWLDRNLPRLKGDEDEQSN